MKKTVSILAICLISFGCNKQSSSPDFNSEVEKWKTELLLNGEVGPPCEYDFEKWIEENPEYYWGMQEIESIEYDFNSDGIQDGLFYFPADNCVGGNGTGSDFAMLVYSHNGELFTNKKLTANIEEKIKSALFDEDIYNISSIVVKYQTLSRIISGSYSVWLEEDPHCCPSINGKFEYNPVDFSIEIWNKQVE